MNPAQFIREGFVEIREHIGRTMLQTLGVILGVASVVATLGMTASMDARRDQYFRESGGTLLMGVYNQPPGELELTARQRAKMGLKLEDAEAIRDTIDGFDVVVAEIGRNHQIRAGATEERFRITATEPEFGRMRELAIGSGRYITDHDIETAAAVVVLGSTRARQLFGTADPVGKALNIEGKAYTVVGVTAEKVFFWQRTDSYNAHEWLNRLITVPITSYMKRHQEPGAENIDELNLRLRSPEDHKESRDAVEQLLRSRHGVEDFGVWDRQERLEQGAQEDMVYNITFMACGVIALLVGGIVITNIMLASFTERMREVGVRKALGATGWQVFVQFLIEAIVVTVFGGAAGLALGIVFTFGIMTIMQMDMTITASMIAVSVASATVVGFFFGLYPAVRASRLDPVVALRYE
ncbi:MAG: ABC transporter permease [Acidobacteria bacterium]|jgi:putative ABC transport system permease protein|nr:ABC transporter permease [Acidobacteriota bacterium]